MDSETAIKVDHLSKTFSDEKKHDFRALDDICLTVKQGESLGIIGANGSGKSTLLKILAGISPPSQGEISIQSRCVGALDVGVGFQNDLSGMDNIILNGQLLGMSHREVVRKAPAIVAFSELHQFINMPVKYYSSGMYGRLSFSVMAFLDGDVFLYDEVISAGDRAFKAKALRHIRDLHRSGKTIVVVSHDSNEIIYLCQRVMWLDHGKISKLGNPAEIISDYQSIALRNRYRNSNQVDVAENPPLCWDHLLPQESPNFPFSVDRAEIVAETPTGHPVMDEPFVFRITLRSHIIGDVLDAGFSLYEGSGHNLFAFVTDNENINTATDRPIIAEIKFPAHLLNSGLYFFELKVVRNKTEIYPVITDDLVFRVGPAKEGRYSGLFTGPLKPKLDWNMILP